MSWPWTSVSLAVWSKFPLLSLKTCSFCCAGFRSSRSIFLWSRAASSTGLMVQLMCEFECKQMIQTGCWWSRQKSLSFSACRLHRSAGLESLSVLSSKWASHNFLSAKFWGGFLCEDLCLQNGHSRVVFCLRHVWRQELQKLWPHVSKTGSLKISWQMEHNRSPSERKPTLRSISVQMQQINRVSQSGQRSYLLESFLKVLNAFRSFCVPVFPSETVLSLWDIMFTVCSCLFVHLIKGLYFLLCVT